jgi:hypothetical protein
MPDTPKLRPYAVAMLFGSGAELSLALSIIVAGSSEQAAAVSAHQHAQKHGSELSLTTIAVMEIEEAAVRLMFNNMAGQKAGEVVALKLAEGPPPVSENEQRARDAQDFPHGPPPPLGAA